jgi:hypothetical protein
VGEKRKVSVQGGKKEPLGRPRHRWEDGIRMDLREIGLGSVEWIQLAQDRDWWQSCEYSVEATGSGTTELVVCVCVCVYIY